MIGIRMMPVILGVDGSERLVLGGGHENLCALAQNAGEGLEERGSELDITDEQQHAVAGEGVV